MPDQLISTDNLLFACETRIARARTFIEDGDVASALAELQLPLDVRNVLDGLRVAMLVRIRELEEELAKIREMGLDQDL